MGDIKQLPDRQSTIRDIVADYFDATGDDQPYNVADEFINHLYRAGYEVKSRQHLAEEANQMLLDEERWELAEKDADELAEELAKWGVGDERFGPQPQDPAIVKLLEVHEERVARRGSFECRIAQAVIDAKVIAKGIAERTRE